MSRRPAEYEFSNEAKRMALKDAWYKCDVCGKKKKETPEEKVLNKLPTDLEVVVPKKGVITAEDLQKWGNNVLTFMTVPLIAFLTAVGTGVALP